MEMQQFPQPPQRSNAQNERQEPPQDTALQKRVIRYGQITLIFSSVFGIVLLIAGIVTLIVGYNTEPEFDDEGDPATSKFLKEIGIVLLIISIICIIGAILGYKLRNAAKSRNVTRLHNVRATWITMDLIGILAIIILIVLTQNYKLAWFILIFSIDILRLRVVSLFLNECYDYETFYKSPSNNINNLPIESPSTFRQLTEIE